MVKAIRVHEFGGPEVLKWEDVEIGEPKEGEIKVKNKAIGLNFTDVYSRKGIVKASTMPFTPGVEAVGVVTAVGPGLTGRKVGDVVAYAGNTIGSYAEELILPVEKVVPVPPSLDPIVAASVIFKGMTAHMLVRRCFKVEPGHTVLVHAAAGGVGSLLCQWANALGATVIGTVSTTEKAAQAKEDGCHHVIMYKEEDFETRVNEKTSGKGVDVVYDSVGKDTFQGSLACLKSRGYMVSYGQSSGLPDPLPMTELAVKSLFLTRATVYSYTATRDELLEAAGEVFSNVASGILRVRINHKYPLSQVAQAHEDLEGRKTSGSVVLIPDGVFEHYQTEFNHSYHPLFPFPAWDSFNRILFLLEIPSVDIDKATAAAAAAAAALKATLFVPCDYAGTTIAFRVDPGSNPYYFAVAPQFEEGDGDLASVDLKEATSTSTGPDEWKPMQQSWGAVWKLESGSALQAPFSIRLTSGYTGRILMANDVIPAGWQPGAIYPSLVNYL
ncbi:hypothetical protein RHGRI_008301 [Rhododendron griersonianum]|uniref:Probable quinone oxidoreductase n=1 Tax=Rhododendron griersonianum TaxID=479676 RepID=A0AAV6L1W6_9ERIC|nr:hypothetical protein RHGRI_008301 [Rhododendron griersonianum]